jgi:hypothetical protein
MSLSSQISGTIARNDAQAALDDRISMKVIAIMTMAFLPATFFRRTFCPAFLGLEPVKRHPGEFLDILGLCDAKYPCHICHVVAFYSSRGEMAEAQICPMGSAATTESSRGGGGADL